MLKNVLERIKHNGERQTLAELRELWIPRGKIFVKQVLRSCIACCKVNARLYLCPKVPDLHPERLNDQQFFSGVGIDYTGSLFCKKVFFNDIVDEDNLFKCYIVIFTCAAGTRGIVLDLVPDASSQTFINSFIKFISNNTQQFLANHISSGNLVSLKLPGRADFGSICLAKLNVV